MFSKLSFAKTQQLDNLLVTGVGLVRGIGNQRWVPGHSIRFDIPPGFAHPRHRQSP